MADAEVIPLGTRGAPGRGTGRAKPSASSRSLAAGATKPAPAARKKPKPQVAPKPKRATTPPAAAAAPPDAPGIPAEEWAEATVEAAKELFGPSWERGFAEFLAYLRRRLTGDYVVDEFGFDAEFTQRFVTTMLRPIAEKWFRIEVKGAENIPADGGALIVSNHSGTIPIDGLMVGAMAHRETGRFIRPLGADLVFRLPIVSELARLGGATLACNEDAERMLRMGELVAVWPEGFKGIGKPFADRYKLQRFAELRALSPRRPEAPPSSLRLCASARLLTDAAHTTPPLDEPSTARETASRTSRRAAEPQSRLSSPTAAQPNATALTRY